MAILTARPSYRCTEAGSSDPAALPDLKVRPPNTPEKPRALNRLGTSRPLVHGPRHAPRPVVIANCGGPVDAIAPAEDVLDRKEQVIGRSHTHESQDGIAKSIAPWRGWLPCGNSRAVQHLGEGVPILGRRFVPPNRHRFGVVRAGRRHGSLGVLRRTHKRPA